MHATLCDRLNPSAPYSYPKQTTRLDCMCDRKPREIRPWPAAAGQSADEGRVSGGRMTRLACLTLTVLNDTLSALNLAANGQMFDDWERRRNGSQCIRCAVVGNAGILNGSRKGQEIDSHDYVFR